MADPSTVPRGREDLRTSFIVYLPPDRIAPRDCRNRILIITIIIYMMVVVRWPNQPDTFSTERPFFSAIFSISARLRPTCYNSMIIVTVYASPTLSVSVWCRVRYYATEGERHHFKRSNNDARKISLQRYHLSPSTWAPKHQWGYTL